MDYLFKAIKSLRPTAEFTYRDKDYATIEWHVLDGKAPTENEINAEIERIKASEKLEEENKLKLKNDLFNKLGITHEELALLLS